MVIMKSLIGSVGLVAPMVLIEAAIEVHSANRVDRVARGARDPGIADNDGKDAGPRQRDIQAVLVEDELEPA